MLETIYAQGFLILNAEAASFRMSRPRVLLYERDRPRLTLVIASYWSMRSRYTSTINIVSQDSIYAEIMKGSIRNAERRNIFIVGNLVKGVILFIIYIARLLCLPSISATSVMQRLEGLSAI